MKRVAAGPYQVGDVLGFSGADLVSRAIKLVTVPPWYWLRPHWRCVSHVGVCARWRDQVVLVESTTLATQRCLVTGQRRRGVQAHVPGLRVAQYAGYVFRLRLAERWALTPLEAARFSKDLVSFVGRPYDTLGAIREGLGIASDADLRSLVCNEIIAAALQRAGRLPLASPCDYTPARLLGELRHIGVYDEPVRIH